MITELKMVKNLSTESEGLLSASHDIVQPHGILGLLDRFMHRLGFVARSAGANVWRNRLLSVGAITSIATMLFISAALFGVVYQLRISIAQIESRMDVSATLKDSVTPDEATQYVTLLQADPRVRSVYYVSPQEAMQRLSADPRTPAGLVVTDTASTLPASIEIRVRDPHKLDSVAQDLQASPLVDSLIYAKTETGQLIQFSDVIRNMAIIALIIFLLLTLVSINNAIRAAVHARRAEIEVMKLVGATDWFVRWPFLLEGGFYGLAGALLAVAGLAGLGAVMLQLIPAFLSSYFQSTQHPELLMQVGAGILFAGIAMGILGSFYSVHRYLDV